MERSSLSISVEQTGFGSSGGYDQTAIREIRPRKKSGPKGPWGPRQETIKFDAKVKKLRRRKDLTNAKIAEKLSDNESRVAYAASRLQQRGELEPRKPGPKPNRLEANQVLRIQEMLENGSSVPQVVGQTGISLYHVRRITNLLVESRIIEPLKRGPVPIAKASRSVIELNSATNGPFS